MRRKVVDRNLHAVEGLADQASPVVVGGNYFGDLPGADDLLLPSLHPRLPDAPIECAHADTTMIMRAACLRATACAAALSPSNRKAVGVAITPRP
ncbi:MAG: hypothetical protein E2P02_23700 [Acidobacteria bacterium]|nr:MAG: hypothetical protein E2P02_23700 [Acidobacteriota bacterium]